MMLVDTSVWVEHFRRGLPALVEWLHADAVLCHPFVRGELACGNLRNRRETLTLLSRLTPAPLAEHDEVLTFVESRRLMGRGIGWIDVHLLASAMLAGVSLWTMDRRLHRVAQELGVARTI